MLALAVLAAGVLSVLVVSTQPLTIIPGDPAAYRERVAAVLADGLPYFEVSFEHLPVMTLPMAAAWVLGGFVSQSVYVWVFSLLMVGVLTLTAPMMDTLGRRLGRDRAGVHWLAAALPLLPLVAFRNDPVAVALFVVAAILLVDGRTGWTWAGAAGALAKIWPAVLALVGWRRDRRAGAVAVALAGAVAVGWTFVPGFSAARRSVGIHAETVMGALVGLERTLSGGPSEVVMTTAAYMPVEGWVVVVNALVGLAVVAAGVRGVTRADDVGDSLVALGAVVAGVILSSQLFSLQYLLWMTPFVALARSKVVLALGVALAVLTTALAWTWDVRFLQESWFYAMFTLRNAGLIVLAGMLARNVTATSGS